MKNTFIKLVRIMILLFLTTTVFAGSKLWELKLESEIVWKQFHNAGLVLSITKNGILYGLEPKTGEVKFKVENLSKSPMPEIIPGTPFIVPNTPFLLFVTKAGIIKPEIVNLFDVSTGKTVWTMGNEVPENLVLHFNKGKMPKDKAQATFHTLLNTTFDPVRRQLILGFAGMVIWKAEAMKSANYMMGNGFVGADIETGKINAIIIHKESMITYDAVTDNPPQIVGDKIVVDWNGLHIYDAVNGSALVALPFKRALKKDRYALKGANPPTLIKDNIVYMVVEDHLEAFDITDGKKKWTAAKTGSAIPEFYIEGDKIVARIGGIFSFTSAGKEQHVEHDPYGVIVYDKSTGKELVHTSNLDKKNKNILITPLLVKDNIVFYGTSASLRSLDLGTLNYKFSTPLDSNDPEDYPGSLKFVNENVILMNTQTTGSFDSKTGKLIWSKVMPSPKMDPAMKMAMAFTKAMAAISAVQLAYSAAGQGMSTSQFSMELKSMAKQWGNFAAESFGSLLKRMSLADEVGSYNYVMTGLAKDAIVVGVNAISGTVDRGTQIEGRVPEFMIDPVTGVLVNVSKSDPKWIKGFDMNPPLPNLK